MFYHFFESIQDFLHLGGWVLQLIFLTVFVLWILIIERFWYFRFNFKKDSQVFLEKWQSHTDSFNSLFLRRWKVDVSFISMLLNKNISYIKTLVALCPLMGLLGTVTGMIAVFEVMAEVGTGNARLMASGVSQATIPTMAGMVGALSGIYVVRILEKYARREKQSFIDQTTPIREKAV